MGKIARLDLPEKSQNTIPKDCRESHLPLASPEAAALRKNGVLVAGRSSLAPGYRIDRAGRNHHLFHITVSGRGRLFHGGGEEDLGPGNVFFAPAGARYRFEIAGKLWSTVWFHLDPTLSYWKRFDKEVLIYQTAQHLLFDQLCACLINQALVEKDAYPTLTSASADLLLRLLLREAGRATGTSSKRMSGLTDRLFAKVHEDLARKWTLNELAAQSGLSGRHLTRVVRDLYQSSPMDRVAKIRMEEAAKLLLYTTHSLQTIADLVGYTDPFSFSAAFKRKLGVSPGAYRRKKARPF